VESVWLSHQLLLGSEADVNQIVEAVEKIQSNLNELLHADHELIRIKQMNRAERR
jgi:transposase